MISAKHWIMTRGCFIQLRNYGLGSWYHLPLLRQGHLHLPGDLLHLPVKPFRVTPSWLWSFLVNHCSPLLLCGSGVLTELRVSSGCWKRNRLLATQALKWGALQERSFYLLSLGFACSCSLPGPLLPTSSPLNSSLSLQTEIWSTCYQA